MDTPDAPNSDAPDTPGLIDPPLPEVVPDAPPPPSPSPISFLASDEALVSHLELLLAAAMSGQLQGLAYVAPAAGGMYYHGTVGDGTAENYLALIGMVEMLKDDLKKYKVVGTPLGSNPAEEDNE